MTALPETQRERDLRTALESIVLLAEQIEGYIRPDSDLAGLQMWADFELACTEGRDALNNDDLERARPSFKRRHDLGALAIACDAQLQAGRCRA